MSRFNYGLRSIYDSAVHGASRVSFRIGDTERAYVTTSGVANNSLAELKADIQDAGSALAIVRDATLYKYRYIVPPVESVIATQAGEEAMPIAQPLIEKSEATLGVRNPPGEGFSQDALASAPQVLGFVIGEGYDPPPDCVLAEDGRGVNLYAMSSVCWRGLQELAAKVAALEKR